MHRFLSGASRLFDVAFRLDVCQPLFPFHFHYQKTHRGDLRGSLFASHVTRFQSLILAPVWVIVCQLLHFPYVRGILIVDCFSLWISFWRLAHPKGTVFDRVLGPKNGSEDDKPDGPCREADIQKSLLRCQQSVERMLFLWKMCTAPQWETQNRTVLSILQ